MQAVMKKIMLTIHIFLLIQFITNVLLPFESKAQWAVRAVIPLLPTSINFDQISAVDDSVVWAYRSNTIFKTVNAGNTWKQISVTGVASTFTTTTLCAINDKASLIAGYTADGSNLSFVYRTIDEGKTWLEVFRHTGAAATIALAMSDTKNGIMTFGGGGSPFTIFKTANAGKKWSISGINTPNTGGASVIDHHGLFVLGSDIWFGTNTFKIFHSPDFGITWSKLNKMPGFPGVINSVSFQNTLDGIVTVTNSDGANITHDGGISWIHAGQPASSFISFTQTALLAGTQGWFIPNAFDDFQIFYSANSGSNWASQFKDSLPFTQGFYDLARSPHTVWTFSQKKIYSYALPVTQTKNSFAKAAILHLPVVRTLEINLR